MMLDVRAKFAQGAALLLIICAVFQANAGTTVFTPNTPNYDAVGIFILVDFESYDPALNIDYQTRQAGSDWISILSNYYNSVHRGDKDDFVNLYSERDGGRQQASGLVDNFLAFKPGVEISNVQVSGMFRVGRLVVPLVRSEITPEVAVPAPDIVCFERDCALTYARWDRYFGVFYRSLEGKYEQFLVEVAAPEFEAFQLNKDKLQKYSLIPGNPEHLSSGNGESYPTVFLRLRDYHSRIRYPLVASGAPNQDGVPLELSPILDLYSKIMALEKPRIGDADFMMHFFAEAFDKNDIYTTRLPLFVRDGTGYRNQNVADWRYAEAVAGWEAIIPVGYLDQGDIRYVYFYPETEEYPVDESGKGVIQMLPVRKSGDAYRLDFTALPFTALSSLQFPGAIEQYLEYYDRDRAPVAESEDGPEQLTDGDDKEPDTEIGPGADPKYLRLILVGLIALALIALLLFKRKSRSASNG